MSQINFFIVDPKVCKGIHDTFLFISEKELFETVEELAEFVHKKPQQNGMDPFRIELKKIEQVKVDKTNPDLRIDYFNLRNDRTRALCKIENNAKRLEIAEIIANASKCNHKSEQENKYGQRFSITIGCIVAVVLATILGYRASSSPYHESDRGDAIIDLIHAIGPLGFLFAGSVILIVMSLWLSGIVRNPSTATIYNKETK